MRIAVFDPFSGIAGDMVVGALVHAGADEDHLRSALATLGLPGVAVDFWRDRERGFACVRFTVEIDESLDHPHRGLADVLEIVDRGEMPEKARRAAHAIFEALARGEGAAHGHAPDRVHFHEVGAVDSIVDVVATALALEDLGIEEIYTRPIRLGSGFVEGATGRCRSRLPEPRPCWRSCRCSSGGGHGAGDADRRGGPGRARRAGPGPAGSPARGRRLRRGDAAVRGAPEPPARVRRGAGPSADRSPLAGRGRPGRRLARDPRLRRGEGPRGRRERRDTDRDPDEEGPAGCPPHRAGEGGVPHGRRGHALLGDADLRASTVPRRAGRS
jgi:hypothetical protein